MTGAPDAAVDCPRCDASRSAEAIACRKDARGSGWVYYLCSVCAKMHERAGNVRALEDADGRGVRRDES